MDRTWILLVEDDPDHEALALRALRKTNVDVDVEVARSGMEALDCLFRAPPSGREPVPKVVLLDLKLPQISGFDVLRRLRSEERTREVPVVVMTSSDDETDIINSYSLGADSFMQKPVDYDAFVETMREVGRQWLSRSRVPSGGIRAVARPIRVLFVEDSADDVHLVTRYLTRAGYQATVERVESSAELQAALDRSHWDLVMADYMVPGFSGPSAVALLQERPDAPPVVIISGAVGDEIMGMQMLLSGARDYLAKAYLARLVPAIGLAAGVIAEEDRPGSHLSLCQVYMTLPEPNLPKAVYHGEQALTGAEALGQWDLYAHAALALGTCFVRMGWAGDAVRVLQRYLGAPALLPMLEGEVNLQLGQALHQLGDLVASRAALVHARDWFAARELDHLAEEAEAQLLELESTAEPAEPDLPDTDDPFAGHRVRGEYFLLRNNPALAVREGLAALGVAGQDPVRTFYSYSVLMRGARVRGDHKEAMGFAVSARVAALEAGRFDLAFQATQSFGEMYLSLGAEAAQILHELEQEYVANGVDTAQVIGSLKELAEGGAW